MSARGCVKSPQRQAVAQRVLKDPLHLLGNGLDMGRANRLIETTADLAAGAFAGGLGALLGIGGGVFLVPFLHVVMGFDLNVASGIGLMTVIGTSSVVSAGSASRRLVNMRLGMLVQVPASAGALAAGYYVVRVPDRVLYIVFSLVTAVIAGIMVSRLDRRNVILDADTDPRYRFGGRFSRRERAGK